MRLLLLYIIFVVSITDYDFDLPERFIAQEPAAVRDRCKMLVCDRASALPEIKQYRDILSYLNAGDVVVINETRVIPARLQGVKPSGAKIEILLLKKLSLDTYEVLIKPMKRMRAGDSVNIADKLTAVLQSKNETDGTAVVALSCPAGAEHIEAAIDEIGTMPLPHYIRGGTATDENYNTVYAKVRGSAAAPTAGLHWTNELIEQAKQKGVIFAPVVLDVGLGTFRPVKVDDVTQHKMHKERYHIPAETADIINRALSDGRRIIATGTTSLRTLEGCFQKYGCIRAVTDETDIFIYPPYKFRVVGALITNFHLPKSTLIMLVSAFIGREKTLQLYETAKTADFRFYSFGDCMFIY